MSPLGRELLDETGHVLDAGAHLVVVELVVEAGSLGAFLVGVAEHPDDVEPGRDQEVAERRQVVVGLAGEPDDHVGADAGRGSDRPDPVEQSQEALGVAEPSHPSQHRAAGVLERQVEVRRDAGRARDRLDQPGPDLGGLEVGHPHPLDAVDGGDLRQQGLQEPQVAEVLSVGCLVVAA